MNRLVNYLKQGKGYGLCAMLIFSIILTLLMWGNYYPNLKQIPTINPNLASLNMLWVHLGFILGSLIFIWGFFLIVTGITAILCWILRLRLNKGAIWRSSATLIIAFFFIFVLSSLLSTALIFLIMLFWHSPVPGFETFILGILGALLQSIIFFVLLLMFTLCGIQEPKKTIKKK